jgi:hypothetical protein
LNENVIEWFTGDKTVSCTFPSGKFARRIIALHNKYPEEVEYVLNKDNSIWAKIPVEYVAIRKPKTVTLTEEQKKERSEQMKRIRQNRKKGI